tara:strand:+ start:163 stop:3300 length:3138 start_codon:yes stop_codon:yes gene_type:complete
MSNYEKFFEDLTKCESDEKTRKCKLNPCPYEFHGYADPTRGILKEKTYGDVWEKQVCVWILKNDPYWKTQFKPESIMSTKDWGYGILNKENQKIDLEDNYGIDLVAETRTNDGSEGEIWGIQAKCYTDPIPSNKIDPFLVGLDLPWTNVNNPNLIKKMDKGLLLITDEIQSKIMRNKIKVNDPEIVIYGPDKLQTINLDWNDSLTPNSKTEIKIKDKRCHQQKALDDINKGWADNKRGKVVMACGTGKTLVGLWAAEQLESKTTLVLVPSLSLINQIAIEWLSNSIKPISPLFVCSDETMRNDMDQFVDDTSAVGFSVTTKVDDILNFFEKAPFENRVIFSTYQSSERIEEAQSFGAPEFDLVIADEAHHCVGQDNSNFARVVDDSKIKSAKKLFMTATPKYARKREKTMARNVGIELVSMDDEEKFGPYFHILNFGDAIKQDLLSDYRVVINIVSQKEALDLINKRRAVKHEESNLESDALTISMMAGFIKTVEEYDLSHVITFHNKIKQAKDMATNLTQLFPTLSTKFTPENISIKHVASKGMTTGERIRRLKRFRNSKEGINILTNARCLTEGVDVRAVDGIVFFEPKSSKIDILQAVGRAIRKSDPPKIGTILLPIVIDEDENPELALENSRFSYIWDILDALKDHDGILAGELDSLRRDYGAKGKYSGKLPSKIFINIPQTISNSFLNSVKTKLLFETTTKWEENFGALIAYKEKHGTTDVPAGTIFQVDDKTYGLGSWVMNQRNANQRKINPERKNFQKLDVLTDEKIKKLDSIGFNWLLRIRKIITWDQGFDALKKYKEEFGHLYVPQKYINDQGFKLGVWMQTIRFISYKTMSPERKDKLNSVGFHWEDAPKQRFDFLISQIKKYKEKFGHALIPFNYISDDLNPFASIPFRKKNTKYKLGEILKDYNLNVFSKDNKIGSEKQLLELKQLGVNLDKAPPDFSNKYEANVEFLKEIKDSFLITHDNLLSETLVEERVNILFERLSERDALIMKKRYGLDDLYIKTLETIGKEFGLTRERVRQLVAKAIVNISNPNKPL